MRPAFPRNDSGTVGTARSYPVAAPHPLAFLWIAVPLLAAAGIPPLTLLLRGTATAEAGSGLWLASLLPLLMLVLVGIGYRRRRIMIDGSTLQISAMLYRKRIELAALEMDRARVIDLAEHTELKPARKTNGLQIPGVRAGHYRMRDGGKAFCLVTDNSRVLLLPLRDGSRVLLSPENPRQLLQDLTRLAAHGRRD
ncbi:PH domain-containing protein [Stenotrophomonas sp. YIM B06876]|uniref:PH domain-containing protein n=1 Tax=Stenotrophomonas sp. YIM B06876 TaxID=3060211 RepID=UPI00273A51A4|nr:PH domain-containing protein [Stenotrophomonas sp. YIM B06876]